MDLSDSAAVRRIWQRVGLTSQSGTPPTPNSIPGTPDALPDLLPEWIAAEQAACRCFQGMACCAGRRTAQTLCCLGRQAADYARQLHALYYVLTGQCCHTGAPRSGPLYCSPVLLRQCIQAAQSAQAAYLRHTNGPYGAVFSRLVQSKATQVDVLLRLLARQDLQNCAGKSRGGGV